MLQDLRGLSASPYLFFLLTGRGALKKCANGET